MQLIKQIDTALALLDAGEVIAYPTEAVYGLGCDIFNEQAVLRILALKKRDKAKGLIILIADWAQLWDLDLIDRGAVPKARLDVIEKSWPGPVTWIFPKSHRAPEWITGSHEGIAIRMTAHPVAHALCKHGPIVSTSANLAGSAPICDVDDLKQHFYGGVVGVVAGDLGVELTVSQVYQAVDGKLIRS
jgi:L-threonylcarbamoyladenylate synthase